MTCYIKIVTISKLTYSKLTYYLKIMIYCLEIMSILKF